MQLKVNRVERTDIIKQWTEKQKNYSFSILPFCLSSKKIYIINKTYLNLFDGTWIMDL